MDKRMLAEFIEIYSKGNDAETARAMAVQAEKRYRRILKAHYKKATCKAVDRLERPLTDKERIHGDWDSWTEYGFLRGRMYTDAEVEQMVDGMRLYRRYSAYDCTGEAFTICISWHRNPSGLISIVHHIGLDI